MKKSAASCNCELRSPGVDFNGRSNGYVLVREDGTVFANTDRFEPFTSDGRYPDGVLMAKLPIIGQKIIECAGPITEIMEQPRKGLLGMLGLKTTVEIQKCGAVGSDEAEQIANALIGPPTAMVA